MADNKTLDDIYELVSKTKESLEGRLDGVEKKLYGMEADLTATREFYQLAAQEISLLSQKFDKHKSDLYRRIDNTNERIDSLPCVSENTCRILIKHDRVSNREDTESEVDTDADTDINGLGRIQDEAALKAPDSVYQFIKKNKKDK